MLGSHILVVRSLPSSAAGAHPHYVAQIDQVADAVAALTGYEATVHPVVCIDGSNIEPRQLPAPTGRSVTVTGLPWLAGFARQTLVTPFRADNGASPNLWSPSWRQLNQKVALAIATRGDMETLHEELVQLPSWWVVANLRLLDGSEDLIELAVVSPHGAFVIEHHKNDVDAALVRAVRGACRLNAYLPTSSTTPVIVTPDTEPDSRQVQSEGNSCWLVNRETLASRLPQLGNGRVSSKVIQRLSSPAPGWARRVLRTGEDWTVEVTYPPDS